MKLGIGISIISLTGLFMYTGIAREFTEQEALDFHSFSVVPRVAGLPQKTALVKLQYMRRQLLAELGLSQIKSGEFWFSVLSFLSMFWVRLYTHYFAQWLFLQGLGLPVSDFSFLAITVNLNYQSSAVLTQEEIGITVMGPLLLIAIMLLLCIVSALSQYFLGSFSALGSRLVCAWGLLTILDPLLILFVDLFYTRWLYTNDIKPIGDAFKLYWHFYETDGSGVPGAFLTLFLYIVLIIMAAVIFYMYFLRLHMNGRMMDTYLRLTCAEDDFFFPLDNELSKDHLAKILKKQEQWRGPKGERRKTAVFEHIWLEEGGTREVTTHVSVHTLYLDGSRELHRQFLR